MKLLVLKKSKSDKQNIGYEFYNLEVGFNSNLPTGQFEVNDDGVLEPLDCSRLYDPVSSKVYDLLEKKVGLLSVMKKNLNTLEYDVKMPKNSLSCLIDEVQEIESVKYVKYSILD